MKKLKQIKFEFLFAWFDLFVGAFWDKKKRWLYFFPFPCVGVVVKFRSFKEEFKTMHVEHHNIAPIKYKVDFIINEEEIKHRTERYKKQEFEIIREHAARHLCDSIYKLAEEDKFNDIFSLKEFKMNGEDYYKNQRRYCIEICIAPHIKQDERYGMKYVEPKNS